MTEPRNDATASDATAAETAEAAADLDQETLDAAAAEAEEESDATEFGDEEPDESDEDEGPIAAETRGSGARGGVDVAAAHHTKKAPMGRMSLPLDPKLRIRDEASRFFVIASIAIFVLILGNAMLFGVGGAFTPLPTVAPLATDAPAAGPGASPSAAPALPTVAPTAAPSAS